jgi:outer membrane receptor protein involved in Fe transport
MVGGQAVHGWQHSLLGKASTTEAGVQLRHGGIDVGLFDSQARVPFDTVSNDRVSETTVGAWLQNATTWLPWWRTLVGLREDRVFMDVKALQTPADGGHAAGNKLSPKVSLVFGPWYQTEFFANAGRGFHSNDARGVVGTAGTPHAVPSLVASKGEKLGLRTESCPDCRRRWRSGGWTAIRSWSTAPTRAPPGPRGPASAMASS